MDFADLVRQPDTLHPIGDVAKALGMAKASAALVVASGLGGPSFQNGRRRDIESILTPPETLYRLVNTAWVTEHPETLVARVRPARIDPDDPDRPFMGWHPDADWDTRCLGVGRWWRIRNPHDWHGKTLVATIVGFVVHVATITGYETAPGGAVGFQLAEPPSTVRKAFENRRIETARGGVTVHLDQTERWSA